SPLPDEDSRTERVGPLPFDEARLLAPIMPSKIICVGRNYRDHAKELGNDVPARDLQKQDEQWTRAKGFDTFCPVGPLITDELDPWAGVIVECRVNGEVRQHGTTKDFIFPLDEIIRYIANAMTLLPGDLIATGTPSGVSPMNAGDSCEVQVEGVGVLRNSIADE